MKKPTAALALAATLAACGQATAPPPEQPASAEMPAAEASGDPADPAAAPADSAEPSAEAPGYSPPQD